MAETPALTGINREAKPKKEPVSHSDINCFVCRRNGDRIRHCDPKISRTWGCPRGAVHVSRVARWAGLEPGKSRARGSPGLLRASYGQDRGLGQVTLSRAPRSAQLADFTTC